MASLPLTPAPIADAPPIDPEGLSLFLDFDGTLVEIVDRPDDIGRDAELSRLLSMLSAAFCGRIGIISGRSVSQIEGFLGPAAKGLAIAGSHGTEIRHADGRREAPARPDILDRVAERFAAFGAGDPGIVVEEKTFGIGLHYRMSPARGPEANALAREVAMAQGLVFQQGKMLAEVRVAGDKGTGLRALIAGEPAMRGTRPIFAGDDVTDEAGFAAAAALGGAGVLVGEPRATHARYRLSDVSAVRRWLGAMVGA